MYIKYPSRHDKDPERQSLGDWLIRQRRLYRKKELSEYKIKILEQIPGWSWDPTNDRVSKNKNTLLKMARNKDPRPVQKTKLGRLLVNYTYKNSCYDPDFDQKIRKLAPHWFVDTVRENKEKLIEMVRDGEPRPHSAKTKLGKALMHYLSKNGDTYDPDFGQKIRKLAPQWFVDTVEENKKTLLEMAKNRKPKPSRKTTKIGAILKNYVNKGRMHDPEFNRAIRKIAPHWFTKTSDENKKLLLEMAQNGEPRPYYKTKLGRLLVNYTYKNGKCYDPDFGQKIRKLAPHWFVKTSDKNKTQLLEMVENGKLKPHGQSKLGNYLRSYVKKGNVCYDPKFDKAIRNSAPHWFK